MAQVSLLTQIEYSFPNDIIGPNPPKVALLCEELNIKYNVKALEFGEKGVKSPEFVALNPNGRVPAIRDPNNNNRIVWESGAILFYLAEHYDKTGAFFGRNVDEKTDVMQWLSFQLSGLGPSQGQVNWFIHYFENASGEKAPASVTKRYQDETYRIYGVLEKQLERQKAKGFEYIVTDRYTIADMANYPWLKIHGMKPLTTYLFWFCISLLLLTLLRHGTTRIYKLSTTWCICRKNCQ